MYLLKPKNFLQKDKEKLEAERKAKEDEAKRLAEEKKAWDLLPIEEKIDIEVIF